MKSDMSTIQQHVSTCASPAVVDLATCTRDELLLLLFHLCIDGAYCITLYFSVLYAYLTGFERYAQYEYTYTLWRGGGVWEFALNGSTVVRTRVTKAFKNKHSE